MKISNFLFEFFLFSLLCKIAISAGAFDEYKPRVVAFLNPASERREFTSAQASKLTHLILHVVFLDSIGTLQFIDVEEDYQRTMRIARGNPTLKVMVNIAGDQGFSDFLSLAFNNTERRMSMVRNIANFMNTTGLDGINIYWHHPVINGIKADRQNYVHFLRELRVEFSKLPRQMCISILTTKHAEILSEHFDLNGIAEHVDFIGSMSYGYNSPAVGARFTGPLAPIFKSRPNESDFLHSTMKTLACGANNSMKINMGIGFYGFYWGRVSSQKLWDMDEMWRLPLDTTFESRFMRWRDIASQYNLSAAEFHAHAMTMYYYDPEGQFFIGTENVRSLETKLDYIVEFGLGGISISALDGDDDNDTLLNTIEKWRSSAKPHLYKNKFRCDEQSTDSDANPVILPREKEWFQRQEKCCEEFNREKNSSLDGPPINCNSISSIFFWPIDMLMNGGRLYFTFFSSCVLFDRDLRECCRENGISDECLPICNSNDVQALNYTENKELFGLNCSVRAQEQAAQCILDGMRENNRKKKMALAGFSIFAPSLALLILLVFFVVRQFRSKDDKIAKSLKDMMYLGEGKFGEVSAARLHGRRVAVKKLKFGASSKELIHEFSILQKLEHPYICKTLHIITLDDCMAMVTELADLGNLEAYLLDNGEKDKHKMLGNQQLTAISLMIARGLEYLFSKNVIHRDLAARNCLVFSRKNSDSGLPIVVKISDFGLARILGLLTSVYTAPPCTVDCKVSTANGAPLNNNDNQFPTDATSVKSECMPLMPFSINGLVLPLRNAAPESVERRKYSKESDIWSFGILLVEIFSYGQPSYGNLSNEELVESISNGIPPPMPDNMPAKLQTLVNGCCQLEPTKRVGIAQIVATLEQQLAVATNSKKK